METEVSLHLIHKCQTLKTSIMKRIIITALILSIVSVMSALTVTGVVKDPREIPRGKYSPDTNQQ